MRTGRALQCILVAPKTCVLVLFPKRLRHSKSRGYFLKVKYMEFVFWSTYCVGFSEMQVISTGKVVVRWLGGGRKVEMGLDCSVTWCCRLSQAPAFPLKSLSALLACLCRLPWKRTKYQPSLFGQNEDWKSIFSLMCTFQLASLRWSKKRISRWQRGRESERRAAASPCGGGGQETCD